MASLPRARRLLPPSLLALVLAVGTVAGAVGRDAAPPTPTSGAPTQTALAAPTGAVLAAGSADRAGLRLGPDGGLSGRATGAELATSVPAVTTEATRPRPRHELAVAKAAVTRGSSNATTTVHRGRNHVWMPALGIDRSVTGYACSRKTYPGDRVYRWGCAGANNIYLFGHAHSVFKSLHDAYVRGKLKKGQELFYADGNGTVHRYTVSWWKVTTPTKGTWAYARQSTPSLTLQTCVGSDSQFRLIVRLSRDD